MSHQVLRMVRAILHLIDSGIHHRQSQLFLLNRSLVIVNIWVVVLEINCIDVNRRHSVVIHLVVRYNRKMVENWVSNLRYYAFLVVGIAIGLSLVDVNVVEQDLYPNSSTGTLIDVEITRPFRINQ